MGLSSISFCFSMSFQRPTITKPFLWYPLPNIFPGCPLRCPSSPYELNSWLSMLSIFGKEVGLKKYFEVKRNNVHSPATRPTHNYIAKALLGFPPSKPLLWFPPQSTFPKTQDPSALSSTKFSSWITTPPSSSSCSPSRSISLRLNR